MTQHLQLVPRLGTVRAMPSREPATERAGLAGAGRPQRHELVFASREDWQAGLARLVLPLECSVADSQSFQSSAIVGRLRGQAMADLRMDASRLTRRSAHIEPTDGERVQVLWLLAGRCRVRQGPNDATLEAGGWTILEPGREYSLDVDKASRVLTLLVACRACPTWLPALPALAAVSLHGAGPAHLAMVSLVAMLRDVAPLDAKSEAALHESVVALVGRALAIEMQWRGLEGRKDRAVELQSVQAYVDEHLHDARLNAAALADVFGISRRNLYNIFLPSGVTPHAYIRNVRLDRACALLKESAAGDVSIATVARQCGFTDPAHFSRSFRARHALAPTAWRQSAR